MNYKMGISRKIREQLLLLHNRGQINLDIRRPGTVEQGEFYYAHLPLAIIDAVFARGQVYEATAKTVNNYCEFYSLKRNRKTDELPQIDDQESICSFMKKFEYEGEWEFRNNIFRSSEPTSFRMNCKSKTMAVYDFSELLLKHGVNYFQDVDRVMHDPGFAFEAMKLSGMTENGLNYFFLLTGCSSMPGSVKMMVDLVSGTAGTDVTHTYTAEVIDDVCRSLRPDFPGINVRILSYVVWDYARRGEFRTPN